jgi:NAD/NADP transhydrogenase alpha subunit
VYTVKCGSELARDEALSVSGDVACNAAIASKLVPTGIEYICQSQAGRKASSRDRAHALENDQDAQALSNQAGL